MRRSQKRVLDSSVKEMAGRLNHPSIVTVYDARDQGLAYIAMEYLVRSIGGSWTRRACYRPEA
jgi:hypothetical protein